MILDLTQLSPSFTRELITTSDPRRIGIMTDVRKGRIDTVVCSRLDRLGRSLPHLAQIIFELDGNGVALVCSSQPIDTSDENPAGRLIMHVLMAMAEFERSLIRERRRAGLKVARAKGVRLGRPATLDAHRDDIATLRAQCSASAQRLCRAQDRLIIPARIDTSKLSSKAFLNVLDAIEEFKHAAANESIRAGLAAARKRGVRLGRPETDNAHRGNVARLRARRLTGRAIAKELGIPVRPSSN